MVALGRVKEEDRSSRINAGGRPAADRVHPEFDLNSGVARRTVMNHMQIGISAGRREIKFDN